jgi:hypothetical protein
VRAEWGRGWVGRTFPCDVQPCDPGSRRSVIMLPAAQQFVKAHAKETLTIIVSLTSGYLAALYRESLSKVTGVLRRGLAIVYARAGLYPVLLRRYKRSLISTHSRIRLGYRDFEIYVRRQYIKLRLRPGFVPPFQQAREEPSRRATSIEEILRGPTNRGRSGW